MSSTLFGQSWAETIDKYSQPFYLKRGSLKERYHASDFYQGYIKHLLLVFGNFSTTQELKKGKNWPNFFKLCNRFPSWPSKAKDIHL